MICPTCGAETADNTKFCSMCGSPITTIGDTQSVGAQPADYQLAEQQVPAPVTNDVASPNKKISKPNKPGLAAAIVFLLGIFLPFASFTVFGVKGEVSLIDGKDAMIFIPIGVAAVISAWCGSKKWLIIVGGIALLLAGFEGYHTFHEAEYAALYSRGIGYFCTLIGSIGAIASGFLWKNPE